MLNLRCQCPGKITTPFPLSRLEPGHPMGELSRRQPPTTITEPLIGLALISATLSLKVRNCAFCLRFVLTLVIEDPNAALTSQTLNADGTPKRPMNAFMIFARRRRPQVSAENQSMRTGEISKILSREWNAMNMVSCLTRTYLCLDSNCAFAGRQAILP